MKSKNKNKNKNKFIPISFISTDILNNALEINKNLHPLIKQLNLKDFDVTQLSRFFSLRSLVFSIVGLNPSKILNYEQLKEFISRVLKQFYSFNSKGYVNQCGMESNQIFNIFRSYYPQYKNVFRNTEIKFASMACELEHFHNLIILVLLFEIELYLKYFIEESKSVDFKEVVCLLKQERVELNKTLSGGIRVSLSRNRLIIHDRIYVGFDTEYKNLDSHTNELLCYTTASMSESLLKIRSSKIDFSLKDGKVYLPKTMDLITMGIKIIRFMRGKKDFELERLKDSMDREPELEKLILFNDDVVYKQKVFDVNEIHTSFHDVKSNVTQYSLLKMLEISFDTHKIESISNANFFRGCTKYLKPVFRPECYLIAHFTTADVSLLSDFSEIKNRFSVLNKSFLTLDKTLSFNKWKVFLRDSSLLSPAGMSLKSIGSLYPTLPLEKIELSANQLNNMDELYTSDRTLFMSYAMQDSKIVLWHSLQVLNSHYLFTQKYTIPVTLSSLASSFLIKKLVSGEDSDFGYHPKTKNGLISVKDLAKLNTPVGIELSGDLHEYIDYFLGSYHGGRNESYVYGIAKGEFYDYDLPGAYPTAMAMINYPDWSKRQQIGRISGNEFFDRYREFLINSYTALKIKFKFPAIVQYPNLPVRLDLNSVIFPLEGETFCTGNEFYLAMQLNCQIEILGGVFIPFKNQDETRDETQAFKESKESKEAKEIFVRDPFFNRLDDGMKKLLVNEFTGLMESTELKTELKTEYSDNQGFSTESNFYLVVKELLTERLKYSKGSYMNLLYKFLANSGIGQMARGLSRKPKYDSKTNSTKILPSGDLVSPLYAGWITSFIRTTLSELMNIHHESRIISCTTDGFISDRKNLDVLHPNPTAVFSQMFFNMRFKLTGKGELLERKYFEPKGVISWRTRGQLGLSGGIKALTGYQRNEPIELTIEKVNEAFNNSKIIPFLQKSLRSAKEIFQYGGHSTLKLSERNFNLKFDNRREVTIEHETFSETKPFIHSANSIQARLISSFGSGRYRVYSPISSTQCKGDAYLSLTKRMLVRVLRNGCSVNLERCEIARIMKEIGLSCSLNFISKQKDRSVIFYSIPQTKKTMECLMKFTVVYPFFDVNLLIRN